MIDIIIGLVFTTIVLITIFGIVDIYKQIKNLK